MSGAQEAALAAQKKDIRSRWLLSAPALLIIFCAAVGPLFVMAGLQTLVSLPAAAVFYPVVKRMSARLDSGYPRKDRK